MQERQAGLKEQAGLKFEKEYRLKLAFSQTCPLNATLFLPFKTTVLPPNDNEHKSLKILN